MVTRYPNIPNHFLYHLGMFLQRKINSPSVIVSLYEKARENCKCAVETWLFVARQMGVVKDIRCLIGELLWKSAWKWVEKDDYKKQHKIVHFFKRIKAT